MKLNESRGGDGPVKFRIQTTPRSIIILSPENDEYGWPIVLFQKPRSKANFALAMRVRRELEFADTDRQSEEGRISDTSEARI